MAVLQVGLFPDTQSVHMKYLFVYYLSNDFVKLNLSLNV